MEGTTLAAKARIDQLVEEINRHNYQYAMLDNPMISDYDFDQLLIDARWQGRGYGTETVKQILAMMEADGKYDKVVLCYVEGNDGARRLYEKFGFVQTWDEDGEIVMEKRIR